MSHDKQNRHWSLESRETGYQGFYRVDRLGFKHSLHQGGESPLIDREQFIRGNVVGVLPYDPVNDKVLLVEQFRISAMHQDTGPWLMEIVAGMIDTDETPIEVAVREAQEEAGLELHDLQLIAHYLASPGASTEEVFIYFTETDLSDAGGVFGLENEGEDILTHVVSATDAINMLKTREIRNALSIIALQWFSQWHSNRGT